MWHFYCLPGRVITEIGYLFPKPGQISASKRRRESGVAAFLFATVFWVLALPFLLPLVVGLVALLIHGLGSIARPAYSGDWFRPAAQSGSGETSSSPDLPRPDHGTGVANTPPTRTLPADDAFRPVRAAPRPKIVFAPHHEVVQAVDTPAGPATQTCSATVTDHCIER